MRGLARSVCEPPDPVIKWPQWHKLFEGHVAVDVHGWSNGRTVQPEHEC